MKNGVSVESRRKSIAVVVENDCGHSDIIETVLDFTAERWPDCDIQVSFYDLKTVVLIFFTESVGEAGLELKLTFGDLTITEFF